MDNINLDGISLDGLETNNILIEPIKFQEHNLWDLELKEQYTFLNNIDEVVNLIKEGKITKFQVKDKYTPGETTNNSLDANALKDNIIIHYTDELHNVAYATNSPIFINKDFYEKYKSEIKEAFVEQIKLSNESYYNINELIYSDELFNSLLEKENATIYFENIELTEEQIKELNTNLIEAFTKNNGINKHISSKFTFGFYGKAKLKELDYLTIYLKDLENNDILSLRYLKENALIKIFIYSDETNEEEWLILIQEKLIQLNTLGKKFTIKFPVNKRSIYNKLFKNLNLENLNIIIENDFYEYSEDEYKKEDEKLDNLISNIKNSPLSPFEKFIAVYNIVKNIKPYKENNENKDKARALRFILDNEYIVCVGYAKLLIELLDKIGINAVEYSVMVDTSYDNGFTVEEKVVDLAGHARVIVNIDDDKYNIHGLYLSDPTWDNNLDKNFFNNALLPFDSMQISKRMFTHSVYNCILDIHTFEEYNEQINFLLKRNLTIINKFPFYGDKSFSKKLIENYKDIATYILNTIKCDPKYHYFMKKLSTCNVEGDYIDFYTELGHYLLTRINQKYDEKAIFQANKEILMTLYKKDKKVKDIEGIDKTTKDDFYDRNDKFFPYKIPTESDFKLEAKKTL